MGAFVGLATLSAVQAWEWLFSGLSKVQNPVFVRQFVGFIAGSHVPYRDEMLALVNLAPGLFPRVVEGVELVLGVTLFVATVVVLLPVGRVRRWAILAAGSASLIGAVTAVNIAFLAGNRPPWTISTAPFGTGVPVEALLAGMSIAGVAEAYSAWRMLSV
jgi:hypothetical protein